MRTYNDGGTTLRDAFDTAKAESLSTGHSVMFEFALVRLVVGPESECTFEFIQEEFRKAVGGISYLVRQL